jgi:diacylglycerol kinase family enzyme
VVNGLLGRPGPLPLGHVPAVAVVPGGSANVFARSLGIPSDPIMATNQLIDLLSEYRRTQTWRRIGLMDCGERWGVFTAGMGVDGEVVAGVESHRKDSSKDKGVTAARYISLAVPAMLRSARRDPTLTLALRDREPVPGVHFVFVSNASPWTYANTRPVWTNPDCSYETGLGVFAVTSMSVWRNLRLVRQMLSKRPKLKAKHLIREDDVDFVRVTAATPIATQIDGDYIGLRAEMTFRAVPQALGVVAPPAKDPFDLQ